MNCFNHEDTASVGICKVCGKGLCPECITDLGHSIACKDKHETEAEDVKFIADKVLKIYKAAPKNTLIGPIFLLFMGAVFTGFGFFSRAGFLNLAFIIGIGFIVFSAVIFVRNRAIYNKHSK